MKISGNSKREKKFNIQVQHSLMTNIKNIGNFKVNIIWRLRIMTLKCFQIQFLRLKFWVKMKIRKKMIFSGKYLFKWKTRKDDFQWIRCWSPFNLPIFRSLREIQENRYSRKNEKFNKTEIVVATKGALLVMHWLKKETNISELIKKF